MLGSWNIQKLTEPFFPGKFVFAQVWAKTSESFFFGFVERIYN